jgi:nucleotidyltransferase AbiEii toxin of type IV toxin-antitoxin system
VADAFLQLSPEEQADILQTRATKLGRRAEHLEKDVWICWVLQGLFGMPGRLPMVFKGGTSLSKVYGAIRRFSEDVDVTVDYKSLDQSVDPFDPTVSRTACDKFTELLRKKLAEHTHNVIRPHFEDLLSQLSEKPSSPPKISADGEKLFIPYPSRLGKDESVFLEFGGRNSIVPNENRHLRPYIAADLQDLEFPEATVQVLSPRRTFWEKATLIHVACNRSQPNLDADRQSRHWHDLAALADHEIGKTSIPDRQLLADVVKHKNIFFRASYANYEACLSGGLRLIPNKALHDGLQLDYEKMIADGMFEGEPPSFDAIIARLERLEKEINAA